MSELEPGPDGASSTRASFRLAGLADAEELARLRRGMFESMHDNGSATAPWSDEERTSRIESSTDSFRDYLERALPAGEYVSWLAEIDDRVVGSAALRVLGMPPTPGNPSGRTGHLLSVYVEPECRRRGIARALVSAAIAWARENGVGLLTLRPTPDGEPLYEQLGFWPSREMRLYLD